MIKNVLIGTLFITLIPFLCVAQTDTTGMNQQYEQAIELMEDGEFTKASLLFKEIVPAYQTIAPDQYYKGLVNIGRCYLATGRKDSANYYIDDVLENTTPDSLTWLTAKYYKSQFFIRNYQLQQSIEILQLIESKLKEINSEDANKILARTEYDLGMHFWSQMQTRKGIDYMHKALALRKKLFGEKSESVAYLSAFMAYGYMQLGELEMSKTLIEDALDYFRYADKTDVAVNLQAAGIYTIAGELNLSLELLREGLLAYEQQEMNNSVFKSSLLDLLVNNLTSLDRAGEAKIYIQELLRLKKESFGEESLLYYTSLINLGNSYTVLEMYDSARYYLNTATEIQQKIKVPDSYRGVLLFQIGKTYLDESKHEIGRSYIRKAIEASNKEIEEFKSLNELRSELKGVPYYQWELAKSYKQSGEISSALAEIQKGLIFTAKKFDSEKITDNPPISNFINSGMAVELLKDKAELLLMSEGFEEDQAKALALNCYKLADQLRAEYNKTLTNKADIVILDQRWRPIYSGLIDLSDSLEEKYKYMETSRAIIFRRNSSEEIAKTQSEIPSALLQYEDSIKRSITTFKSEMLSGNDSIEAVASANYYKNKRKLDSLFAYYTEQYPSYYRLKYAEDIATIEDVRQSLDKSTIMLQFHVGEEKIYSFSTSDTDTRMDEITLTDSLRTAIDTYKEQLRSGESYHKETFESISWYLYDKLVSKTLAGYSDGDFEKLVILPDGILWNVNFELLLTAPAGDYKKKDIPYLFRDFAIRYVYSQSVLKARKNANRKSTKSLLAFSYGDTDITEAGKQVSLSLLRSEKEELPGSRQEIKSIANLVDGDYYYGSFASEQQFKEIAADYKILHLAVHGITDSEEPDHSRLDFYQKGESDEDGQLHAFELYDMRLNADLAVLSACNTGSGSVEDGEGIMSIGRAFSYAGVNSLLLTRWEISDTFTPQIMETFYGELKAGKTKSEALRTAKLTFLENSDNLTANPFYWASFYILGDDKPVEISERSGYWIYIIGAIAGILIVLLVIFGLTRNMQ
ncbi:MAG: CHAT domain-containing protein [Cyclobacteriaceae bacterium]